MVDEHKSLQNRNSYPPSRSQNFPLHGCQSFLMGSSFRANETILLWSLNGRPIPAPYQHIRNDDHTVSTETSHNIHSQFLHYDIHRQHYGGLISTNRAAHTLPICAWRYGRSSVGAWNMTLLSEFVISQANSTF